jgi:hypothetical protein
MEDKKTNTELTDRKLPRHSLYPIQIVCNRPMAYNIQSSCSSSPSVKRNQYTNAVREEPKTDEYGTGLDAVRDIDGTVDVGSKHRRSETVGSVIRHLNNLYDSIKSGRSKYERDRDRLTNLGQS